MAKRKRRMGKDALTGKFMPAGRETTPPQPDPRYTTGQHVVHAPPTVNAKVVIPEPTPPRQAVPVLRADPRERPRAIPNAYRERPYSPRPIRNKGNVIHQLTVLIAAFEEVEVFDPLRGHNGPPPALWIADGAYLQDVKSLLHELRKLNDFLSRPVDNTKTEQAASLVARAIAKFVEGYAGALGKGAAALTIGAAATLLYNIGVGKEVIEPIWGQLKVK